MQYREYKPRHLLSQYLDFFWSLKIENYQKSELNGLRLPDHSPEWIFNLSNPERSRITLNFKDSSILVHEKPVELIGIRFRPYGLAKLGDVNMRKFRGTSSLFQPALVFFELADKLEDLVFSTRSIIRKIASIEEVLMAQISQNLTIDTITKRMVKDISLAHGNLKIKKLCQTYNLSKTTLNNKLVDAIGMSPKELARVYRFNFFLRKGIRGEDKTFTELAQECGYYDQSHLNHEFKIFTGMTPTQLFDHSSSVIVRGSCNYQPNHAKFK